MKVHINHTVHEMATDATLADAIAVLQPTPPFAAAVNMQFVPNTQYQQTALKSGDRIDVIAPLTGG